MGHQVDGCELIDNSGAGRDNSLTTSTWVTERHGLAGFNSVVGSWTAGGVSRFIAYLFLLFKSMAPLPLFDLVYMHSVTTLPEKKPKLHSGRMGRERQKPAVVATPDQSLGLLCRVVFRV